LGQLLGEERPIDEYGIKQGSTVVLYRKYTLNDVKSPDHQEKLDALMRLAPHLFSDIQTEEYIEANVLALENPQLIPEMSRLTDLAVNLWESSVGGFCDLVRDYCEIEQADLLVQMLTPDPENTTVIPDPPSEPSTDPLPLALVDRLSFDEYVYHEKGGEESSSTCVRAECRV
jgi:hypothetical protein